MLRERPKSVRNPDAAFWHRREKKVFAREYERAYERARLEREKHLAAIASTPTIVITDEGSGEPETDVPAHLGRLQ